MKLPPAVAIWVTFGRRRHFTTLLPVGLMFSVVRTTRLLLVASADSGQEAASLAPAHRLDVVALQIGNENLVPMKPWIVGLLYIAAIAALILAINFLVRRVSSSPYHAVRAVPHRLIRPPPRGVTRQRIAQNFTIGGHFTSLLPVGLMFRTLGKA
jgi:hypothetical protein